MSDDDKTTEGEHSSRKRYAVRATNHTTGEVWAIEDSKTTCERELAAKRDDWGKKADVTVDGPVEVDG